MDRDLVAAFWARVNRSAGTETCWPWTGSRTKAGYGRLTYSPLGTLYAHRMSWELSHEADEVEAARRDEWELRVFERHQEAEDQSLRRTRPSPVAAAVLAIIMGSFSGVTMGPTPLVLPRRPR